MTSSLESLLGLLGSVEFLTGLGAALLMYGTFALFVERTRVRPWGVALTIGFIVAIWIVADRRVVLPAAAVLILLGGWGIRVPSESKHFGLPAGVIRAGSLLVLGGGMYLLLRRGLPWATWIRATLGAGLIVYGVALPRWRIPERAKLVGLLFLITAFGIWVTVPDTERARVLLGAALGLATATLPALGFRVTSSGAFGVGAATVWMIGVGGLGRGSAIVGAIGAVGILAILPAVETSGRTLPGLRPWVIVAAHILIVLLMTRVFGLWTNTAASAAAAAATMLITFAVFYAMSRPARAGPPPG